MKKKIIVMLLASMAISSLNGCGLRITAPTCETSGSYASESPAYVEEAPAAPVSIEAEPAEEEYIGEWGYEDYGYDEEMACEEAMCETIAECEESAAVYGSADMAACTDSAPAACVSEQAKSNGCFEPYELYAAKKQISRQSSETYKSFDENKFTDVAVNPLSTFAADVDTASYANFRRMVEDGNKWYTLPTDAIRVEEMVNYFDYGYKAPKNGDMFGVCASIIDCPWNEKTKLVNVGIKAKEVADETKDIPSNIVFLIDVSGSMADYDKLPLLQMAFEMLVDDLTEKDRVSIVTYASSSDVVLAGVKGDDKVTIKKAMNNLTADGCTNGGAGIIDAYRLADKYFIDGGNNRVILATDGDLNVGITSDDDLERLISNKKESGVFLSVLGFGTGNYNEANLETLADKGNGNYSYIDSLREAKKVLHDEFDSTLFTVAKDVKFQIEFNPAYVSAYHQIGYENRQMAASDFADDKKDGGEIGSGHSVTVMYEVVLNEDSDISGTELKYQKTTLSDAAMKTGEWMTVNMRYKEPAEDKSVLESYPITKECYTKCPTDDTLFAAYVAKTCLMIKDSEYVQQESLNDVYKELVKLDLDDEYKLEFVDLVESIK